ncbi:MAG: response regulator [Herpetosiphonaceae bacterium]|nr:response regulator [Herpetosiphonaceae bacterium]
MVEPQILLAAKQTNEMRQIVRCIEEITLRIPIYITTPEAVIDWLVDNDCDLCLLDDSLPRTDPLEFVTRIHQRKPDLSIIMLSANQSAQAAVAAFHVGVVDYVPKQSGFQNVIARHLGEYMQKRTGTSERTIATGDVALPAAMARATYQNRLRVIGRQLDLYGYHSINLLEVGGGFLVRALAKGNRTPQALEFSDRDFPQLVIDGLKQRGEKRRPRAKSELLPTGYEDFLRALGYRFDAKVAEAITVAELDRFIVIGGVALVEGTVQQSLAPFQAFLQPDDILSIVNEAVRRRSTQQQPRLFNHLIKR